ncbi:MAG: SgcJ/EcaC family oxidoreductase [Chloroflexota bacterium]|nr:MAG: SgcJ/EcaC family oxidoreductase [Chloroflexota bacterium]
MALDHPTVQGIADAYTAAWNSGSADAVASFYAEDGRIVINAGSPWEGRSGVAQMAAGFFADVPDLALVCDEVRLAGTHVAYLWTFSGTHASSGTAVRVSGWEEWDLDDAYQVKESRGWFDAEDYARQTSRDLAPR